MIIKLEKIRVQKSGANKDILTQYETDNVKSALYIVKNIEQTIGLRICN